MVKFNLIHDGLFKKEKKQQRPSFELRGNQINIQDMNREQINHAIIEFLEIRKIKASPFGEEFIGFDIESQNDEIINYYSLSDLLMEHFSPIKVSLWGEDINEGSWREYLPFFYEIEITINNEEIQNSNEYYWNALISDLIESYKEDPDQFARIKNLTIYGDFEEKILIQTVQQYSQRRNNLWEIYKIKDLSDRKDKLRQLIKENELLDQIDPYAIMQSRSKRARLTDVRKKAEKVLPQTKENIEHWANHKNYEIEDLQFVDDDSVESHQKYEDPSPKEIWGMMPTKMQESLIIDIHRKFDDHSMKYLISKLIQYDSRKRTLMLQKIKKNLLNLPESHISSIKEIDEWFA